jgi:hypothetical protein
MQIFCGYPSETRALRFPSNVRDGSTEKFGFAQLDDQYVAVFNGQDTGPMAVYLFVCLLTDGRTQNRVLPR